MAKDNNLEPNAEQRVIEIRRSKEKEPQGLKLPNPCPIIKFEDLNNRNEQDIHDCNKPHPAVFLGLKWTF